MENWHKPIALCALMALAGWGVAQAEPRFVDTAVEAGIDFLHHNGAQGQKLLPETMGSGVAFFDYDNDARLDLYFANAAGSGALFRNSGVGRFDERTATAGVADSGYAMGALAADYDNDGDQDLYITCYGDNILYRNEGAGRFVDATAQMGVGDGGFGTGVAAGDWDLDGDVDILVTNFYLETNTLYHNEGGRLFADRTTAAKLGRPSLAYLAWGTAFFDWDLDGDEDLFVANGHMDDNVELFEATTYAQRNQMFRNDMGAGFAEVDAGLWAQQSSRGTAVGDYDDDGDLDVAVVHINARASLLRNDADGHWLAIRLAGGVDGVGARVSVRTGDRVQVREARRGGSYLSSHDPRLYFGLGEWTKVDAVEIRWPGGAVQRIAGVAADQLLVVEERP